jgi:hypothetical protein
MVVHADDARYHGVAAQIEHSGTCGRFDVCALLDRRDRSALDDDVLIVNGCGARAVNYPDVCQHDGGCVHAQHLRCEERHAHASENDEEPRDEDGEEWRLE